MHFYPQLSLLIINMYFLTHVIHCELCFRYCLNICRIKNVLSGFCPGINMLWIICCIEKLYIVSKFENGSQCGTALNQYCLLWQQGATLL